MQQQVPELLLTDPEAAQALINVAFLGEFREPASPSDVARRLGMPANLAHHHAQKCLRLGLLFEARREKGKVLYQLSARSFKVPRRLAGEGRGQFERMVGQLSAAYLHAYDRSESYVQPLDGAWSVCTFGGDEADAAPLRPLHDETRELRPALFVQRTLKLTPERYRTLLSQISELIQEVDSERDDSRSATCTIAALGFEGVAYEGLADDSLTYSSFFTPQTEESR